MYALPLLSLAIWIPIGFGVLVDGSAGVVGWFSTIIRKLQSGYIYNYAFAMIFGIVLLLTMTLWTLTN